MPTPTSCDGPNADDGSSVCRTNCHVSGCGDGVAGGLEDCDGTDLAGQTCGTLGFYGGALDCTGVCIFDTTGCTGYCGDGVRSGAEECDGDDLGGQTCEDLGLEAGPQ